MAITIHLFYRGEGTSALDFAEEMTRSGVVAGIREEEGNLGYDYYRSLSDPSEILLIDRWRDQSAIDAHHASVWMQEIFRLREKYDLHMRVERFEDTEGNLPEQDRDFIRG